MTIEIPLSADAMAEKLGGDSVAKMESWKAA